MASGYADVDTDTKLTPEHKLLSGSVGKLFFAGVILKLIEDQKLGLQDYASKYLIETSWYKTFPNYDEIKIINLLTSEILSSRHIVKYHIAFESSSMLLIFPHQLNFIQPPFVELRI